MINYDKLEKVGEYRNGELNIWFKPVYGKDEGVVYLLRFGNDYYIGSSSNVKKRIYSHIQSLRSGKHSSPLVQRAFNNTTSFEVYLLMRTYNRIQNMQMAEQGFILLLNPSLNGALPKGSKNPFIEFIWKSKGEDYTP